MYPSQSPKMILMMYMIDLDNKIFNDFFHQPLNFFQLLDFGKVSYSKSYKDPYRIYYRKPYQNPKVEKNLEVGEKNH